VAELLKPLGYATGQFGMNHLGDKDEFLPINHGFDGFFGNLYPRLLPLCEAADRQKILTCLMATHAIYAAGARVYRMVSCHDGERWENAWAPAGV